MPAGAVVLVVVPEGAVGAHPERAAGAAREKRVDDLVLGIDHPQRLEVHDRPALNGETGGVPAAPGDLDHEVFAGAGLHPDLPSEVIDGNPFGGEDVALDLLGAGWLKQAEGGSHEREGDRNLARHVRRLRSVGFPRIRWGQPRKGWRGGCLTPSPAGSTLAS